MVDFGTAHSNPTAGGIANPGGSEPDHGVFPVEPGGDYFGDYASYGGEDVDMHGDWDEDDEWEGVSSVKISSSLTTDIFDTDRTPQFGWSQP